MDPGLAQTFPSGFSQVRVTPGLTNPSALAFAPDGRIFVCEQGGNLRVIKNDVLLSTPFVSLTVNADGERGLIGIALDPNFSANGFVYLYYTLSDASRNRISRFTANGDVAVAGSETVVLDLDPLIAPFHNGGAMHFGVDGKLFVAIGENGRQNNSQDLNTYHGKILRINPDGTVPAGNPFTDGSEQRKRVWSYGLRNPYTMDVQPGTGKFYINDVGNLTWEEINDGTTGGLNFGWPANEGIVAGTSYTNPIYAYGHGTGDGIGCAITGGVFFNPQSTSYPSEYFGKYFFMDLCGRWLNYISPQAGATRSPFATNLAGQCLGLELGPDGNLYYVARSTGSIYKIVYSSSQQPTITDQPDPQSLFEGETANFSVSASGAPPLSYQWRKNAADISGATGSTLTIPNVTASDAGLYSVRISNSFGSVVSTEAELSLLGTNSAPVPVISAPVSGSMYRGGDVVTFSGTATDPEEGALQPSALTWQIDFHHAQHVHDAPPIVGVASGSFQVPTVGETSDDVWYRVRLTATDAQGRTGSVYRDVLPYKSQITIRSEPDELQLTLDGQPITSPFSIVGVEGIERQLGVVASQIIEHITYEFDHWMHGGDVTQVVSTPADDVTYTAVFRPTNITGVSDIHIEKSDLYPNPTSNFLSIENAFESNIEISDLQGKMLYRWINSNNEDRLQINFSISPGVYLLKVIRRTTVEIKRVVIK